MTDHAPGYEEADTVPRLRRYGRFAAIGFVGLAVFYWLSPYVAVARFALAAQAGATETLIGRIDVPGLRGAFARQIVRAYIARHAPGRQLDPFSRQAVSSIAGTYVGAIIAEYLTPEVIADLLGRRLNPSGGDDLLGKGLALPRIDGLANAWSLFIAAGFSGPASFSVEPGEIDPAAAGYRLNFGLVRWSWLLRSVELPPEVLARLADELKARIDRHG